MIKTLDDIVPEILERVKKKYPKTTEKDIYKTISIFFNKVMPMTQNNFLMYFEHLPKFKNYWIFNPYSPRRVNNEHYFRQFYNFKLLREIYRERDEKKHNKPIKRRLK